MQGVVQEIKSYVARTEWGEKTAYSIKVNGTNYSTFQKPNCSEGDTVEFEFTRRGNYCNIKKDTLNKLDVPKQAVQSGGDSGGGNKASRSAEELNRIDALKLAMEVRGKKTDPMEIIKIAQTFDKYISEGMESPFFDDGEVPPPPADTTAIDGE